MTSFDEHIILRYLEGSATEEELRTLERWIGEDELNRIRFYRLSDLYHAGELQKKVREDKRVLPLRKGAYRRTGLSRGMKEFIRIAAAVVITAGMTWGAYSYLQQRVTAEQRAEVISVPAGSVATVLLPDSTKVWLNAESTLTYDPEKFGKRSRDVQLTGEAYFDVTRRGRKAFTVNTSKIRITVYGTRFNVKAYPEDATIETTLEEGKIELTRIAAGKKTKTRPVILQPDQRAVLVKNEGRLLLSDVITTAPGDKEGNREISVKSGKLLVADKVDTEVYTSWKDGRLIIRGEPLEHLAKKLERRYDVQIIFRDNDSKALRFTGILENETLEQVLFAIRLTSPIRYTIDHKTVYLEKIR
jgi:ferric-dicitrate binding protein FerR (iron transport regulator)